MRAVIQRVSSARIVIERKEHTSIGHGILVLVGIEKEDTDEDAQILAVSQFTLLGDCRRGLRPSFDPAAPPEVARTLYERFVKEVDALGVPVVTGVFQAMMDVELTNQGPVTFILDSRKRF